MEEIGDQAFDNVFGYDWLNETDHTVIIPAGVNLIGTEIFNNSQMRKVAFAGNAPTYVSRNCFGTNDATNGHVFYITYPSNATGWSTPTWKGYPCYPEDAVPPFVTDSITLTASKTTMIIGESVTIASTVLPTDAIQTLKWTSSSTSIATVNTAGKVTGVAPGTTTITATATDGSGKQATIKFTVNRPVTSIKLDKTSAKMLAGQTLTLKPTVGPSNATNKTVTWSSSDTKVATVTSGGVVKAVGSGTVTITAKPSYGSPSTLSASCIVTVN